jgi:hypothetical protein
MSGFSDGKSLKLTFILEKKSLYVLLKPEVQSFIVHNFIKKLSDNYK